jgi:hypothetical protein
MAPPPPPAHDRRPGATAATTMRLGISALLCMSQYFLLTVAMEAWHAGEPGKTVVCFVASAVCFALCVGLLVTGELGYRKTARRTTSNPPPNE